jgi:hypothetical protein
MVSIERLDVRSIVSGKQATETRRDSITSGGSGMPCALGVYDVLFWDEAIVSVVASTQRRRSGNDGFCAFISASAYAPALDSSSSS